MILQSVTNMTKQPGRNAKNSVHILLCLVFQSLLHGTLEITISAE
jgi:hypothetical protein